MRIQISIYRGRIVCPVLIDTPDRVRVQLPGSQLTLTREGPLWIMPAGVMTLAREKIVAAWNRLAHDNPDLLKPRKIGEGA